MAYTTVVDLREVGPVLTVGEAAEFLHVHANTLRRWSDAGLLTSFRIGPRGDRRFLREDLMSFVRDHNPIGEDAH